MKINYQNITFLTSAAELIHLPEDSGIEVAFAGRSNVGKSSALNTLTKRRDLARTSKTPGRTQLINLFALDEQRRLVDLPGYGYAKVSHETKQRWQKTLSLYLESRACLRGLVLLIDIRHPLKTFDLTMIDWATHANLSLHLLLTKADKLSRNQINQNIHQLKKSLRDYPDISMQAFSSFNKMGLEELEQKLDQWFFEI